MYFLHSCQYPFVGAICSPRKQTRSPTFKLGDGVFHFANRCNWHKYSSNHQCQKSCTTAWHQYQRRTKDVGGGILHFSSRASSGRPMRKRAGVNVSILSDASGKSTVVISANVNFVPPTTTFKCFLKLLTTASHKPPKCGACSGVNFHLMLEAAQKSGRSLCLSPCFKNAFSSSSSCAAPTKLVPWSSI